MLIGSGITVWQMSLLSAYIDSTSSNLWLLTIFVEFIIEFGVMDVLAV